MIDRYLMSQFNSYYQSLIEFDQQLHEMSKTVQDQPAAAVFWLSVNQGNETSTLKLSGGLLEQNHFLSHHVYQVLIRGTFLEGLTLAIRN